MLVALLEDAAPERDEHCKFDPVRIEMLLLQERQRTARRSALLRIGVRPHPARHHPRMRFLVVDSAAHVRPNSLDMRAPLRGEPGIEVDRRTCGDMYVTIDDMATRPYRPGPGTLEHNLVHAVTSDAVDGSGLIFCSLR